MAEYKFTIQRGKTNFQDVTIAAGAAEAQTDTISLNIDTTNLTRGDIVMMIERLEDVVNSGPWPPI